jgi:hypothetical protein
MNKIDRSDVSRTARRRIFEYLNCNQCTLSTQRDYLGVENDMLMQANCHLEGGGFSAGSTCGVVSGGCQSLALRHMDDLRGGDPRKMAAFHSLLREYTTWFERTYGSTICRERTGCKLGTLAGLNLYVLGGRFGRCIVHAGGAARFLAYLEDRPLWEEDPGEVTELNHCAVEVLRRLRETTGAGDDFFDTLYISMNGGVGLSGGLCGAAAAGYLPIGWKFGLDPERIGFTGNLAGFWRGHINLYGGRGRDELWSLGCRFIKDWRAEFGSLECRDLTGMDFYGYRDFAPYVRDAAICRQVKEFAVAKTTELLK